MHVPSGDDAALRNLASELNSSGYEARVTSTHGKPPCLTVRNPSARILAETVIAQAGWYWYSWAERIAPLDDANAAAAIIARVLRTEDQPARA